MAIRNKIKPAPVKSIKRSVSFPTDLLSAAEERAAKMNRTFSNYMQFLASQDLKTSKTN